MKNKPQQSLRIKVGRIITGFSFLMVMFYSYMLLMLKDSGLRDAAYSVLVHEANLFIDAYTKDPDTPLPRSYSLRGFISTETLPENIAEIFPPHSRDTWNPRQNGFYHYLASDEARYVHHHMYVRTLPGTHQELFLYYRLPISKDSNIDIWKNVKQVALLGFVLVILMLLVLHHIIRRALNPISSLANWINQLTDNKKPKPLPKDIQNDEIGRLARNLFHALERINSHNEHERSFLRNASHELRTPIAIIRNTMDVIEHKDNTMGNPEVERLLKRIRRASDTMKAVTEAILWLAVDEYAAPDEAETDLKQLVDEVIRENHNLIDNKSVTVHTDLSALGWVKAEKALVHIALDNLIRNAFQHCSEGDIEVKANGPKSIGISNNRSHINDDMINGKDHSLKTGGFGLGLALVQSIAEKKQWRFDFSLENDYARATLEFG